MRMVGILVGLSAQTVLTIFDKQEKHMFHVYQYQDHGTIVYRGQAHNETQAVADCNRYMDQWEKEGKENYGACFYTRNGLIAGDFEGPSKLVYRNDYDYATAGGSVLTGREW